MTEICIIAALSEKNRVIGKDGQIPWRISADLKHFRELTTPHPIIMGRITFESIIESIKKPLPNRQNIVITNKHLVIDGVMVKHNINEALSAGKMLDQERVFIIGGGEIYHQTINLVDRLFLTLVQPPVEGEYSGDTFFPDYSDFKNVVSEELGTEKGINFKFVELTR